MTYYPREAWYRHTAMWDRTPHALWDQIQYQTFHQPGTHGLDIDGPDNVQTPEDAFILLRSMDAAYQSQRGYVLGYNAAIDMIGNVYEIRGLDYKCAANGNGTVNTPAVAIQFMLRDPDDTPTNEAVEAARWITIEWRKIVPRMLLQNGHQDMFNTGCPGAGVVNQLGPRVGGVPFGVRPNSIYQPQIEVPIPPKPQPIGDKVPTLLIMFKNVPPGIGFVRFSNGELRQVTGSEFFYYKNAGVAYVEETSNANYDRYAQEAQK